MHRSKRSPSRKNAGSIFSFLCIIISGRVAKHYSRIVKVLQDGGRGNQRVRGTCVACKTMGYTGKIVMDDVLNRTFPGRVYFS